MALVVICGIPASGKSTLAQLLVRQLQSRLPVTVIDEPSLHLDRRHSFQGTSMCYLAGLKLRPLCRSAVYMLSARHDMHSCTRTSSLVQPDPLHVACQPRAVGGRRLCAHGSLAYPICFRFGFERSMGQVPVVASLSCVNSTSFGYMCNLPTWNSPPQVILADAAAEKRVRSQLKSAVERALSKDRTVILDSLNSIKGYRSVFKLATAPAISGYAQLVF